MLLLHCLRLSPDMVCPGVSNLGSHVLNLSLVIVDFGALAMTSYHEGHDALTYGN